MMRSGTLHAPAAATLCVCFCFLPASGSAAREAAEPSSSMPGAAQIDLFADYWTGSFSNERQAAAERNGSNPGYPEAVRLTRDMRVRRLEAPAIGPDVLYLEEIKMDQPDKAHRQRVMTFDWHEERREIEVQQLFFSTELAYDRPFIPPEEVEKMRREDFALAMGCNLFFAWDEALQRFKGGMRPRQCEYEHPVSGPVYAEFDMILDRDQLWYRDRSIKIPDGDIRGEIDGFSWLRFDRLSRQPELGGGDRISREQMLRRMPVLARMEGVWDGQFRRVDASGELIEAVASRVIARFLPDGEAYDYHQVNITRPGEEGEQRIESWGKWDVDRLRFSNARLNGWAQDLAADESGLTAVFSMTFTDGSGLTVSEIVSLGEDGNSRMRATQYIRNGRIVRRTLIDETRAPQAVGHRRRAADDLLAGDVLRNHRRVPPRALRLADAPGAAHSLHRAVPLALTRWRRKPWRMSWMS